MPHARSDSPSSYSSYATSSNSSTLRRKLQTAVANQNGGKSSRPDAKEKKGPSKTTLPQRPATPKAAKAPQVDEIENLREMLVEKQQEMTEEKNPDRKKDLTKDLEILKQWLKDKEQKAATGKDVKDGKASEGEAQAAVTKTTKRQVNDGSSGPAHKKQAEAPRQKDGESKEEAKKVSKQPKKDTKDKAQKAADKTPKAPKSSAKECKRPAADIEASKKEETAEAKSASQVDNHSLLQNADTISQAKSELQQTLTQQRTEAFVHAVPSPVQTADPAEMATAAPKQDVPQEFVLASEATTLMPSEKVPPCELPLWCVMPNPRDVEKVLEIVRHVPGSNVPSKRMRLGRRAWALLGRRLHEAQAAEARRAGVPEPDIGLACPLSSKAHAVVLQNWTGKIFLKDLGSAHGTFLSGVRLNPHEPFEWQAGTKAFFADASTEFFELRAA